MKIIKLISLVVLSCVILLLAYLFWPLSTTPHPASFHCYPINKGTTVPLEKPKQIFGIGLSYAGHIKETASRFSSTVAAPVFRKHARTMVYNNGKVRLPQSKELLQAIDALEPGIAKKLRSKVKKLNALLDYEVELGFVLLEAISPKQFQDPTFVPKLGFFVANDLSARSLAILGEGRTHKHAYWGVSKSFPGFLPLTQKVWVPHKAQANGIPCIQLETKVNGVVRQKQQTNQMIYTPLQMIRFVHQKFPQEPLEKGTVLLTGTPAGVAIQTPRWMVRAAKLLGVGRFQKLAMKLKSNRSKFLKVGDTVTVSGQQLGAVKVKIVR